MAYPLNIIQVIQLFGQKIYLIPDNNDNSFHSNISNPSTFISEEINQVPVQWYLKPEHRAAFIVSEFEFNQKDMKLFIRSLVEKIGLNKEAIGFGIIRPSDNNKYTIDAPVQTLFVFLDPDNSPSLIPTNQSLQLYHFNKFENIIKDKSIEKHTIDLLSVSGKESGLIPGN